MNSKYPALLGFLKIGCFTLLFIFLFIHLFIVNISSFVVVYGIFPRECVYAAFSMYIVCRDLCSLHSMWFFPVFLHFKVGKQMFIVTWSFKLWFNFCYVQKRNDLRHRFLSQTAKAMSITKPLDALACSWRVGYKLKALGAWCGL